jgi:hypothetical protein
MVLGRSYGRTDEARYHTLSSLPVGFAAGGTVGVSYLASPQYLFHLTLTKTQLPGQLSETCVKLKRGMLNLEEFRACRSTSFMHEMHAPVRSFSLCSIRHVF